MVVGSVGFIVLIVGVGILLSAREFSSKYGKSDLLFFGLGGACIALGGFVMLFDDASAFKLGGLMSLSVGAVLVLVMCRIYRKGKSRDDQAVA